MTLEACSGRKSSGVKEERGVETNLAALGHALTAHYISYHSTTFSPQYRRIISVTSI
jgi:hypothetical protein